MTDTLTPAIIGKAVQIAVHIKGDDEENNLKDGDFILAAAGTVETYQINNAQGYVKFVGEEDNALRFPVLTTTLVISSADE